MSWGYHLLLNCRNCDPAALFNAFAILSWLQDLLSRIDMKAIGEPWLEQTGTHDPKLSGYTLMQCIETSSITAHFVDSDGSAYIDVFSCKDFNTGDVEDCVRRHFRPEHIGRVFLERQA